MHHPFLLLLLWAVVLALAAPPAVAAKGKFANCRLSSNTRFINFERKLVSNLPVLFPKSEAELKSIVKRAGQRGCRVRVRGSGHTTNGMVAQMTEKNVVIVHLKDVKPAASLPKAWKDGVNAKTCVATIGAGRSWLDLAAMARPLGCVAHTTTAYPFFSIGGVIANQVAGNGHGAGMLYDYVVGVRVLLPSGEIRTITDTNALRFFRGSYGLTGIILQVKYQLTKDRGMRLSSVTKEYDLFNGREQAYGQLMQDQLVMQQQNVGGGSECFMNVFPSQTTGKQSVTCFVVYNEGNTTFPSNSPADKKAQAQLRAAYQALKKANPNLAYTGGTLSMVTKPCEIIPEPYCRSPLAVAAGAMQAGMERLNGTWLQGGSPQGARDGYFPLAEAYPYSAFSMYIPAAQFASAVASYVALAGQALAQGEQAAWLPNLGFEWRFVTPRGTSAFDTLQAGVTYVQFEVINGIFALPTPRGYAVVNQQLEQMWAQFGAVPHAGKDYGFDGATGLPFQHTHTFYTSDQVAEVNAKLDRLDPKRIFSAGSAMLDFNPKRYVNYTRVPDNA